MVPGDAYGAPEPNVMRKSSMKYLPIFWGLVCCILLWSISMVKALTFSNVFGVPFCGFDAVHHRHADVQQGDIDGIVFTILCRLQAVFQRCRYSKFLICMQNDFHSFSDERIIIRDNDINLHGRTLCVFFVSLYTIRF